MYILILYYWGELRLEGKSQCATPPPLVIARCAHIAYQDDILLMCQSQSLLRKRTSLALNILQILGFVINWEKSELNSVQMILYLGFLSNSMLMQVSLPDKKIKKLKKQAGSLL